MFSTFHEFEMTIRSIVAAFKNDQIHFNGQQTGPDATRQIRGLSNDKVTAIMGTLLLSLMVSV